MIIPDGLSTMRKSRGLLFAVGCAHVLRLLF
nr:MAG TPA: hypothetical protein [Caudoviricetes sp.]